MESFSLRDNGEYLTARIDVLTATNVTIYITSEDMKSPRRHLRTNYQFKQVLRCSAGYALDIYKAFITLQFAVPLFKIAFIFIMVLHPYTAFIPSERSPVEPLINAP